MTSSNTSQELQSKLDFNGCNSGKQVQHSSGTLKPNLTRTRPNFETAEANKHPQIPASVSESRALVKPMLETGPQRTCDARTECSMLLTVEALSTRLISYCRSLP